MLSVASDSGIERYDDLHVDQVDPAWRERSYWVAAALEAFELAVILRDPELPRSGLRVALAFSLVTDERETGVDFHSGSDLSQRLSATPPSIYLLWRGMEFWVRNEAADKTDPGLFVTRALDAAALFGESFAEAECHYLEFRRDEGHEFSRSVFLVR